MIRQDAISVEVEETNAAVTNFAGIVPLSKFAESLGLFADLESGLPSKERKRGYTNSQSIFDLRCIPFSGGECIEDLDQLRRDEGLARLLKRKVMASRTAHDFLRRIRYDGLDELAQVRRRMLRRIAKRANVTTATLDCDACLCAPTPFIFRHPFPRHR